MPNNILDFEKPVYDLEEKLKQLRQFGKDHDIDVAHGVKQLQEQIQEITAAG